MMRGRKRNLLCLLAAIAVTILSFAALLAPLERRALATSQPQTLSRLPAFSIPADSGQIFNDNLVVERGQVLDGDVTVLSGNADVESGGEIHGNLIVMSGNVKLEEGGVVQGDVIAVSGNVKIEGAVHGNVSSVSGNIELEDSSHVQGDVSVISGNIDQEEGARLDGGTFHGPNIEFSFPGNALKSVLKLETTTSETIAPETTTEVIIDGRNNSSFGEQIGLFILRLIGATIFTVAVALFCGFVMAVRPDFLQSTTKAIRREMAMNFVTGLIANLSLVFLMGLLAITVCLLPVALVPLLILLLANILGWAAMSNIVGQRVATYANLNLRPAATVALGALALTAPISLLWAFGGCLRVIMFVALLVISSLGSGAVILPWLRRLSNDRKKSTPTSTGNSITDSDGSGSMADTDAAETNQEAYEAVDGSEWLNMDDVDSDVSTDEPASPVADYSTQGDAQGDAGSIADFTQLQGIGPVANLRLHEAGIQSFAELATMSTEQVGEILGWSAARVQRNALIEQARRFATS